MREIDADQKQVTALRGSAAAGVHKEIDRRTKEDQIIALARADGATASAATGGDGAGSDVHLSP